jgi:DNA (cytosine-5)-methyltransferase 1
MKPVHKFPYRWRLADGYPAQGIEKHGKKVFGTFICGGGSTMGYKLAGFHHLGGVEIDPKVTKVYKANHHPQHLFNQDIRDFLSRADIPDELFDLDLLDGSPPCSSFSIAGNREKDWNKEKKFAEGQELQKLDDLFFTFIALAKRLQPKVVMAENVKGLLQGNAKFYVSRIKKEFEAAGYKVQLFLFNAATMGVPQKRERVFFICQRKDLNLPDLSLRFTEPLISFENIMERDDLSSDLSPYQFECWQHRIKTDYDFGAIIKRRENRNSMFSNPIFHSDRVAATITSSAGVNALYDLPRGLNTRELCRIGSYPIDYDFGKLKANWLIGMSVPPVMTAQIAHQIHLQWLSKLVV